MKRDPDIFELVERLRSFHDANKAERLSRSFLRWIEDPLKPRTKEGKLRVNPTIVLLLSLILLATGTFAFFSLVRL